MGAIKAEVAQVIAHIELDGYFKIYILTNRGALQELDTLSGESSLLRLFFLPI